MEYAIAVFDIGKTNKKLLIYDRELNVLDSAFSSIPTRREGDLELEDVEGIEAWFRERLRERARAYNIRVISVATHGATFVCVGDDGTPAVPVVSYTHEPGDGFHEEFYRVHGARDDLQRATATLELKALINPAQGLYFARRRFPEAFARVRTVLLYPQYFGFRLTGQTSADLTYAGCHTYLWDFRRSRWSSVVEKLGISGLMPSRIGRPWEVLGRITPQLAAETGLDPEVKVTLGIHDSNASLLPHLAKRTEDFVLNSTGTWCVAMHPTGRPTSEARFSKDEIGKAVFFNISAMGTAVKTSILMGGLEYDTYTTLLRNLNGIAELPVAADDDYRTLAEARDTFILPGVVPGSGQYPASHARVREAGREIPLSEIEAGRIVPSVFRSPRAAVALLNLSLAVQTRTALERVGLMDGVRLFTEGGFRNNADYNRLVTAFFPESGHSLTDVNEATAFGAAMVGRMSMEQTTLEDLRGSIRIEDQPVAPIRLPALSAYADAFHQFV